MNTTDDLRALSASDLLALGFGSMIAEVINLAALNALVAAAVWLRLVVEMKCSSLLGIKAVRTHIMRPIRSLKLRSQPMNADALAGPKCEIPLGQLIPITLILGRLQK